MICLVITIDNHSVVFVFSNRCIVCFNSAYKFMPSVGERQRSLDIMCVMWHSKKKGNLSVLLVQGCSSVLADPDFDCYAETGLFFDQFLSIFEQTKEELRKARIGQKATTVSLACDVHLLLLLNFMREGGTYR